PLSAANRVEPLATSARMKVEVSPFLAGAQVSPLSVERYTPLPSTAPAYNVLPITARPKNEGSVPFPRRAMPVLAGVQVVPPSVERNIPGPALRSIFEESVPRKSVVPLMVRQLMA